MKSLITTLIALGLIAPHATYAMSIHEIIENAKAGSGIYVESHSSASTGGQTAAAGQTVTTGDASASSHVEIRSDTSGGSVKVNVSTSGNGTTTVQEYTQPIEAGIGAKVEVNASSKNGESKTEVKVNDTTIEPTQKTAAATTSAPVPTPIVSQSKFVTFFSVKIPGIFKQLFSFFWRF